MIKSEIIALFDQDQRKDVEFTNMRQEVTPDVVRHIDSSEIGEGMITYSRLNDANAEDIIREQVNFYESIGQDFEWKVYECLCGVFRRTTGKCSLDLLPSPQSVCQFMGRSNYQKLS